VEGRALQAGEVVPACVQTCPPCALVFGDLNDPNSAVSQLATSQRKFRLLDHLGTQPQIIYLKGGDSHV
jgi:molybdopterin-containing oxidoreductase family iron-sulfur binding subunit